MIGHQAVGGAEQAFSRGGVEHHFAEAGVEWLVEPSAAAHGDGESPMNDGVALIVFAWQPGEAETAIDALAVERIRAIRVFLRLHESLIRLTPDATSQKAFPASP